MEMSSLPPPTKPLLSLNLGSYCDLPTFIIYVIAVVQLPDGSLQHFGNPELGFSAFNDLEQTKKRSSLDWVLVNPLTLYVTLEVLWSPMEEVGQVEQPVSSLFCGRDFRNARGLKTHSRFCSEK